MFKKLRELFRSAISQIVDTIKYRTLSESEVEEYLQDLLLKLVEADVAYDVAKYICDKLKHQLVGIKIPRASDADQVVADTVRRVLRELLEMGKCSVDLVQMAKDYRPLKVLFMGVNGVGKTTTIAKVAYMLKNRGLKVVVVGADTFRAAAQEQLKKHCERIGVQYVGGKYGADPAATAYDGIVYAEKRGFDVVLIDTAGRMHVDEDLMNELRKVVRVVNPHLKILVIDALTGNDAVEQAKRFDEVVGVDAVILTKVDADAKGGAALSTILSIGKPIMFLGVGQKYDDLIPYDPDNLLKLLL